MADPVVGDLDDRQGPRRDIPAAPKGPDPSGGHATPYTGPLAMSSMAADTVPSPYAGEESRAVKSLSAEDVAELRRGGGWGLAKAAELNGMPGRFHLLEHTDEIPLTREQVSAITAIYERMREAAIAEGEYIIAGERALEDAFRAATLPEKSLRNILAEIARSRTRLRFIHLSAHLETPALLTHEQDRAIRRPARLPLPSGRHHARRP